MTGTSPSTVLTITWRRDGGATLYRVNGDDVGADDAGFDAVLAVVRADPDAVVTLVTGGLSLGGESLQGATPFAARFAELREALGSRSLRWSSE